VSYGLEQAYFGFRLKTNSAYDQAAPKEYKCWSLQKLSKVKQPDRTLFSEFWVLGPSKQFDY